jgi:MFS superfamily sulfate permease-like transporter
MRCVFRPQSPEHPDDESFPGLLLLRSEGPIFFANAAQIAHKIEPLIRETRPKVVAVDASGVLDMEYTALKMFAQIVKNQSQRFPSGCRRARRLQTPRSAGK